MQSFSQNKHLTKISEFTVFKPNFVNLKGTIKEVEDESGKMVRILAHKKCVLTGVVCLLEI